MTKKLEEEFDLPPLKEALEENEEVETTSEALTVEREEIFTALKAADKIDQALPVVRGLETNDVDMDSYSNQAEQAFKDLMDLGMNVEARHAGDIFAAAQRMLKNAIEAKTSKTDKKLKMIELQLKKLKLDQDKKTDEGTIEGEGYVIADRNDILKSFIDKENDK
tara:strand:+ start:187 stop:681 length:495 start_codon:yes stop_codon:yes gene_type:complete